MPSSVATENESKQVANAAAELTSTQDLSVIRGAGYVWGHALRALYATAFVAPDGTKELNITNLVRSYKGVPTPINLSDPSVPPTPRAEYLAATITAALDMPSNPQGPIARTLERFYSLD